MSESNDLFGWDPTELAKALADPALRDENDRLRLANSHLHDELGDARERNRSLRRRLRFAEDRIREVLAENERWDHYADDLQRCEARIAADAPNLRAAQRWADAMRRKEAARMAAAGFGDALPISDDEHVDIEAARAEFAAAFPEEADPPTRSGQG